jgi:hypothetical protein
MHPFSLNNDEINLVSGARIVYTTLALGEEGGLPLPADSTAAVGEAAGTYTTMALGEEGGLPPVY